jgi:hypothetical protein
MALVLGLVALAVWRSAPASTVNVGRMAELQPSARNVSTRGIHKIRT